MERPDTFSITIVGAGMVGLAAAEELAGRFTRVLVVEKNESFGREISSRHSGVVHAGLYYPPGSLKARFCREGNGLLYDMCRARRIPHRRTGKLIIALNADDEMLLEGIRSRAESNGVDDLSYLSTREVERKEPALRARSALFSPSTGIIDAHLLMRSMMIAAESSGAIIAYRSRVTGIEFTGRRYRVEINNGAYRFETDVLVNCGGLQADFLASLAGIDIDTAGYRLHYCKGSYFSASPAPAITHLVYPAIPYDSVGLGIHATLDLGGRVRFGPDAEYIESPEYTVSEAKRESFWQAVSSYLPELKKESLQPDMSGVRPKLQGPGEPFRDFCISDEREKGRPNLINLIGIESPGLTACVPIARYLSGIVGGMVR